MARRVFFSFHYADVWRANVIRNSHIVEGTAVAGFQDASLWEEAKKKGDAVIKNMINRQMEGTSVTCVLIGQNTWQREYVTYEIEQSVARGNGLVGIRIYNIRAPFEIFPPAPGTIPQALSASGAPVYVWDRTRFAQWVEDAYQQAQQRSGLYKIAKPWGR